jgi:hypothetical protein
MVPSSLLVRARRWRELASFRFGENAASACGGGSSMRPWSTCCRCCSATASTSRLRACPGSTWNRSAASGRAQLRSCASDLAPSRCLPPAACPSRVAGGQNRISDTAWFRWGGAASPWTASATRPASRADHPDDGLYPGLTSGSLHPGAPWRPSVTLCRTTRRSHEACATGGRILASRNLVERLSHEDAAALGVDVDRIVYTALEDLDTATEKARRDAPAIPVCEL